MSKAVVLGARRAMEQFRYEVARELGLELSDSSRTVADHPARPLHVAAIRGEVPKRMVELAEQQMGRQERFL